ncbi:hypothetical protein IHV12_09780 [Fictibacillus sp. 7GRE50]|uniref:hypothetical protein n=1 Tax=Fictibacillus TaxID=1329200 RepID=UPI0018CE048F|nr:MULTISPECIES: hypothetical protein [unclassified Fictibacillus]MBH0162446.1 hypothetical protein [Fictibacillus sp. 26RED30]MBH0165211.1 hypothetical protein [Fictibacillus sp. 7GRE50]
MAYYIACDYDEPDRQSYRGIVIIDTLTNEVAHRFFSGDFDQDFQEYRSWLEDTEPFYFEGDSLLNFVGDLHDPALNENDDFYH